VQVDRLASSIQRGFSCTAGTLTVTSSADPTNTMQVAVSADSTLQQIADSLNAKSSGPVVASVIKKGTPDERIVPSSRTTGSDSDFTVTGGNLSADAAYITPDVTKLDALYSLDAVTGLTSKPNVLEARMAKEPEMIHKLGELLAELRDAWSQVSGA